MPNMGIGSGNECISKCPEQLLVVESYRVGAIGPQPARILVKQRLGFFECMACWSLRDSDAGQAIEQHTGSERDEYSPQQCSWT